jgi:nitrogen regulatory protein PII
MKKIEALIRPHQLEDVKSVLCGRGLLHGMTSTEVHGYTNGVSGRRVYRGLVQRIDLFPRIKLELVAHDDLVERVLEAIEAGAPAARDREILVSEVAESVRIRTGEIDEAALA